MILKRCYNWVFIYVLLRILVAEDIPVHAWSLQIGKFITKKKDYLPTFFAKGILNIFLVRLEWLWSFKHHCTTTANLSNGNKEASDHCCQINYSISLLALSLANVG